MANASSKPPNPRMEPRADKGKTGSAKKRAEIMFSHLKIICFLKTKFIPPFWKFSIFQRTTKKKNFLNKVCKHAFSKEPPQNKRAPYLKKTQVVLFSVILLSFVLTPSTAPVTMATSVGNHAPPGPVLSSLDYKAYKNYSAFNSIPYFLSPEESIFKTTSSSSYILPIYLPSDFDLPLELNEMVWEHILCLENSKSFKIHLERAGFYSSFMKKLLAQEGCPTDLFYLALIESGFNPTAVSHAGAAGPWQFMPSTGKLYGLKINEWVDERLNIEKSTRAAGRHLQDLYGIFESWPLVLASYNAGPGTIKNAIARRNSNDFWTLVQYNDMRKETKKFVPTFYASMIIGKHPERFGIGDLEAVEDPDPVPISAQPLTDLATISKISGAPLLVLQKLNAQYLYGCTPSYSSSSLIWVPKKYSAGLQDKVNTLSPDERNTFQKHTVREKETLYSIARRYDVPTSIIKEANNLLTTKVKTGQVLVIPKMTVKIASAQPKPTPKLPKTSDGKYVVKYVIGKNDTLYKIAKKADVSVDDICRWNNIKRDDLIHPGQTVTVYCSDLSSAETLASESEQNKARVLWGDGNVVYHTVKEGETVHSIARKYGVSHHQIITWNGLKKPYHLKVGSKLKIVR